MYNAQCSDTVGMQSSFIIHHPTLLAPFPSHLFPPESRRDISRDLCYGSVTDAALREYHQIVRPSTTTARRQPARRCTSKQTSPQMMMQSTTARIQPARRCTSKQTPPQMMMQSSLVTTNPDRGSTGSNARNMTPRMMMRSSAITTTPDRSSLSPTARDTTARRPKKKQRDPTNTGDSLFSDLISDKVLKLTKPLQWGGRSATPLADDGCAPSQQSSCSHRHMDRVVNHRYPTYMEQHHAAYGDVIHEFMKVSLVFNLFQGSPDRPVDERYIGPKCKLPILRHRLQRLFNRKIIDTTVQYDIYRLLDPGIGVHGNTTIQPETVKRAWDEGFYDPVNRDIPLILRHRTLPSNNGRLKKMVLRFGKGMSGLALTTMPARPYSYNQQLIMNSYAYSMQFSNRLTGTITIPGAPILAPAEGAAPVTCPFDCKHGDINGGRHAFTCKKLARHVKCHALVEDAVALMIMDALAIPIKQGRVQPLQCCSLFETLTHVYHDPLYHKI